VLNDSSGLHLTAGPFMLFYSSLENSAPFGTISRECAQEGLARPLSQETYSLLQKQFSEWSTEVREIVRRANSRFRTRLEDERIVDDQGRLRKQGEESVPDSPMKGLWVDPLELLHTAESEKDMVYDSDPEEMKLEDIPGMQSYEASASRSNTTKGIWDIPASSEAIKDDKAPSSGWVPQGDPEMTWEEADAKGDTERSIRHTNSNWDGWGAPPKDNGRIEVQVTRTVETDSPEVRNY
jgi:hypothetical protein